MTWGSRKRWEAIKQSPDCGPTCPANIDPASGTHSEAAWCEGHGAFVFSDNLAAPEPRPAVIRSNFGAAAARILREMKPNAVVTSGAAVGLSITSQETGAVIALRGPAGSLLITFGINRGDAPCFQGVWNEGAVSITLSGFELAPPLPTPSAADFFGTLFDLMEGLPGYIRTQIDGMSLSLDYDPGGPWGDGSPYLSLNVSRGALRVVFQIHAAPFRFELSHLYGAPEYAVGVPGDPGAGFHLCVRSYRSEET